MFSNIKEFYLNYISIFVGVSFLFLLLRIYFFKFLKKISENLKFDKDLKENFLRLYLKIIKIFYFVFLLTFIYSFPIVNKYISPIVNYSFFKIEAIKLSLYSLIKGILVFYILYLLTKLIRVILKIFLIERTKDKDVVASIDILIYNGLVIFIVIISLSTVGISWKLLIPVAGALGIGVGFGLQDIVSNLISGFIILITRNVKIGDLITVGDNFGRIVSIGLRTSTLRTIDNIDIIIPNSHLISNQLINWSYSNDIVRIHIPIGVAYNSDVEKVKEILLEVANNVDFIIKDKDKKPTVTFKEFGDNSLNFELLVWINVKRIEIPFAKSELNFKIWKALKENGIEIPFPQQDIWFKNELKIIK